MQAKLEFTEFFIVSMSLPEDFLKQLEQYSELSNREKEVFIEIFGRGKSRVQVAQTLNICDSNLSSCLTGIYNKFQITGSGPVKEPRLREYLEKQYSEQKFPVNANADIADDRIDALVQKIRDLIKPTIKEKCGTMRVLDMAQPIELTGERGIYTNVNILEKLNRNRRIEISELLQNCNPENFNRFGLSKVTEKRVPGLEAVQPHSKLMVLGKPGAGKTTFLKYLAMHCIEGEFLTNKVPFFITLKEFAEKPKQPDLLEYMAQQLLACNVKDAKDKIDKLLSGGRGLILLDGLDEVREEDTKRILNQILEISDRFYTNQFLITCRIAAKEYTFERFTEVEMADFDKRQIKTFSQNWFRLSDPVKADSFIQRLEENEPIYELGTNPLLLTLLCLVFGENNDFPANRSELYKEGVDILLKKWDAKRNIERDQVYKNLSLHRKEDLLSQIALTTFEQGDYFFKQKIIERYIADFIYNLRDARTEPEELEIDSEAVLKSIESQHGLLVERARGIYSFSHLTFHEYFTAKEIVANSASKTLVEHITEKRWREVFFLTIGMMRKADDLLVLMKHKIDGWVAEDKKLQSFLVWIIEKSSFCLNQCPQKAAIRAFCIAMNLDQGRAIAMDLDRAFSFDKDSFLIESGRIVNNFFDRSYVDSFRDKISSYINKIIFISPDFTLGHTIVNNHEVSRMIVSQIIHFSEFEKLLNELKNEIYEKEKISPEEQHSKKTTWLLKINTWMKNNLDIFCYWDFDYTQKELLKKYLNANIFLLECLKSDCYVSREVRQEIEDTLLLPMSEIEKRNKQ